MIKKGDKVWVYDHRGLREVEVLDVFTMHNDNTLYVDYGGLATTSYYNTKNEAVESRLNLIHSIAKNILIDKQKFGRGNYNNLGVKHLLEVIFNSCEKTEEINALLEPEIERNS